jgi:hypothetical protein
VPPSLLSSSVTVGPPALVGIAPERSLGYGVAARFGQAGGVGEVTQIA